MRSRYGFDSEHTLNFITSTIVEFIPVFTNERYFSILMESFKFCRNERGLSIHAYVILDNHFHLIVSGENLSNIISSIKRHTAKHIIKQLKKDDKMWLLNLFQYHKKKYKKESQYQVWQEGCHPQLISSNDMLEQKMNYIHANPVQRGLILEQEYWKYSSARNYILNDDSILEIDRFEW